MVPTAIALLLTVSIALMAAATFASEPAAAVTNGFSHTIGAASSTPSNPYPLSGPPDLDIDQVTRDIYVTDPSNSRVEKFDAAGNFILMFGKNVNQTTGGDLCPVEPGDICQAGTPTSSPGGFKKPTYIAVDNFPGSDQGSVYVGDVGNAYGEETVTKFDPGGHPVAGWGIEGQKDGSDINKPAEYDPSWHFEGMNGLAIGGTCNSPDHIFFGECTETPTLYVAVSPDFQCCGRDQAATIEYTRSGAFISWNLLDRYPKGTDISSRGFEVDALGNHFSGTSWQPPTCCHPYRNTIGEYIPETGNYAVTNGHQVGTQEPTTGFAFHPNSPRTRPEIFQDTGTQIFRYADCEVPPDNPCEPLDSFGSGHLSAAKNVAVDGLSNAVLVANTGANNVVVFGDIRPIATTGPPTDLGETSATFTGHVDLAGHAPIVGCEFEYGLTVAYGTKVPCAPDPSSSPFTGPTDLTAEVTGLTPTPTLPVGSRYHYRLVVENEEGGIAVGQDQTATTIAAPTVTSLSSSGVTATEADLQANVNPNNLPTSCYFEYGSTTEYGSTAPCAPADLGAGQSPVFAAAHIVGLNGGTYHFRVVAENALGADASEDQIFEFFPPACPNSAVRQQTGSAYLPDCRAYELVSPPDANATLLYSGGPTSPYATSPSRFAFTGAFSTLPGVTNNIGTVGDLYIATRSSTGWGSSYVGPSSTETGCAGGPPNHPWAYSTHAEKLQNPVLTDRSLGRILDFKLGTGYRCYLAGNGVSDASNPISMPSNAPYLWDAEGNMLARLPSSLGSGPEAEAAFDCPTNSVSQVYPHCTTDVAASGDLTHLAFSSRQVAFAPGGLTVPPGSAYDNDLTSGEVTLISILPGGAPIPQDPGYALKPAGGNGPDEALGGSEEFIRFPAVSTDGSHILMSTATENTPFCSRSNTNVVCQRFTDHPLHLYMSIGHEPAIEVSKSEVTHENVGVNYLDMSPDGSRVYFTTPQKLKSEDLDTSTDLYMWTEQGEEAGEPLTLISKAAPGAGPGVGDSDACSPVSVTNYSPNGKPLGKFPWTFNCGIVPYSGWSYSHGAGGIGGNGSSDSGVASESGDVYFYSPEPLDGLGVADEQNLYVYRGGEVHHVATLTSEKHCANGVYSGEQFCASGPIARLQVAPDGFRAALVTGDQLTNYDNAGHLEMYLYTPSTGKVICASCRPDGQPPSADVQASQNGRFLTEDGRAFFSTTEPLVLRDTNQGFDIYEFVAGRAQLITSGTGTAQNSSSREEVPGLVGVSADGTDVYFATYDTLISEDRNGTFMKFYDARSGGGFSRPPATQPCAAAEECHGPSTEAPVLPAQGSAAALGGGNVTQRPHKRKSKSKAKRRHRSNHRRKARKARKARNARKARKSAHRPHGRHRNSGRGGQK